ncbi:MAG: glycine oxidase ThiO [Solirubrobacterales bacterium]
MATSQGNDEPRRPPARSGVAGARRFDVLVVGAGVIGLACAWRAAQRGLRVRVLERDQPGAGASGVAAGMLAPVGEATWGEEELLALALRAHEAWPGFATELATAAGREVGYIDRGAVHVALDRDEAAELRRRFELMRELGLDAEWLRPREARRLEPGLSPTMTAAIHAPHEAASDPRALVAALWRACEEAGVEVLAGAQVVDLVTEGGSVVGVRDAGGDRHSAPRVVVATGAWSGTDASRLGDQGPYTTQISQTVGWLPAEARPPVRPVKGQILTLRGSADEPLCARIVVTERIYAVPRADGRLVVGATVEEQGFDSTVTAGGVYELLREAYRALPEVAELELVETIAGLRPGTPDNRPLIGPGAIDGLVLATGHYRNGILLAPVTADAVAGLLADEGMPEELRAFSPARFAAPPAEVEAVAP